MTKEDLPMAHAGMAAEEELQKKYYDEGRVFILQIESTLRCPQLCNYCYAKSMPDSPHGLSSKKIYELLDFASEMNVRMIEGEGLKIIETEDLSDDFASHVDIYVGILKENKQNIIDGLGDELYEYAEGGLLAWQKAAHEKKVGRGLFIAKKP